MITSINQKAFRDTLFVILRPDSAEQQVETKENVTRIFNQDNETLGYNIQNVSEILDLNDAADGQIFLTAAQVDKLNELLTKVGMTADLVFNDQPTVVYGYVETCIEHPDSDHLHITEVNVGREQNYQIVCGAKNIAAGEKVVVALPGAMMPDGSLIWPGALRSVDSFGMICSARELGVKNAPNKPGILELPADFEVGAAFDREKIEELIEIGAI